MKKCFLHRAIAFLLSIVVLIGFVGCGNSAEMHCVACGAENDNAAKFCVECGANLSASTVCQSCGQENGVESKFCSSCGNALSSQSNQGTQNNGTTDGTEGTNGNQPTVDNGSTDETEGMNGNQPTVDSGTTEGDSTNEPDPAEDVWLKVKRSAINGYSYSVFQYDYNGYLTAETNYLSSTNTIQRASKYVNNEHGDTISHSFSTPGKTINETYQYEYDENGNKIKEYYQYQTTGPSSKGERETAYTYDANGLLIETADNGGKVVFSYDDAGKLFITKAYDKTGNATNETKYFYSENGLLTKKESTTFGNENNYTRIFVNNYLYSASGVSTEPVHSTDDDKRIRTTTYTYLCDKYGNIIQDTNNTYEYMSLAEYRKQGLCDDAGKLTCGCSEAGYSMCQGHNCTDCTGTGKLTCKSCNGSGKDIAGEFNGSDACRVCYGTGWWICDNCGGSGKWFSH